MAFLDRSILPMELAEGLTCHDCLAAIALSFAVRLAFVAHVVTALALLVCA